MAARGAAGMNAFELPLHFLRPWWWLALLPLPFAVWMVWRGGSGRAALARLVDASLLPFVVHDEAHRRTLGLALLALAWLLAVVALSGPAWQRSAAPLYVNGAARVVVLSLSNDMLAADVKPDRMTHARFAVHDLIDHAGDARQGHRAVTAKQPGQHHVPPMRCQRTAVCRPCVLDRHVALCVPSLCAA